MKIDKNSDIPIYIQIYNNIADGIKDGYLSAGERLKSRRVLSAELGVAQRTVENAYNKLLADEYIVSKTGSGYYVSTERIWDEEHRAMKSTVYNFSTNGVETSKLPFTEWSRLLRRTVREDTGLFQHGEKAGEWCLRKSIRRMLFKEYGIRCQTDNIIIGPGAEDLLRDMFLLLGYGSTVIMNNYYYYRVNSVALQTHMDIRFITNGPEGIDTDELDSIDRGLLYIKPTHDLPTAVTLDDDKRRRLVEWADGKNRFIIEDSAENIYCCGEKHKTLYELSGGSSVIYLGSFSNTIAPSMKIGYIVVPDAVKELWFKEKRFYSNRVSRADQVTLSKFIDLGHYERHVAYMREIYRAKTLAFRKAVDSSELGGKCKISGDDTGMYCLMEFDIRLDEKDAVRLLRENGVKLSSLSTSIHDPNRAAYKPNTYVVGYGEMTISQIREGVKKWAKLLKPFI